MRRRAAAWSSARAPPAPPPCQVHTIHSQKRADYAFHSECHLNTQTDQYSSVLAPLPCQVEMIRDDGLCFCVPLFPLSVSPDTTCLSPCTSGMSSVKSECDRQSYMFQSGCSAGCGPAALAYARKVRSHFTSILAGANRIVRRRCQKRQLSRARPKQTTTSRRSKGLRPTLHI